MGSNPQPPDHESDALTTVYAAPKTVIGLTLWVLHVTNADHGPGAV